jgi:DNA-binding transcriptional LysR family regulator
MGLALVPEAMTNSGLADVAFRTIASATIRSEAWCVWRAANPLSPTVSAFIDEVQKQKAVVTV